MTVEVSRDGDGFEVSRSKDGLTNIENEAANRISSAFDLMKLRMKRNIRCESEIRNQFLNGPIKSVSFCNAQQFSQQKPQFSRCVPCIHHSSVVQQ